MRRGRPWLLTGACLLAIGVPLACQTKEAMDEKAPRVGRGTIDDEVYLLPPLSAFEAFPEGITADLATKCQSDGLSLVALKRTKGDHHQSIYAEFGGGPADPKPEVLRAFRAVGKNFLDIARCVVVFPGHDPDQYWVATGAKLTLYAAAPKGETPLTDDEFWSTLSQEITPEPPACPGESDKSALRVRSRQG
ncbi:MAG TPA: hypothetical protein VEI97_01920 [bacterium]|nr:hypothetical protein [bacterium]